MAQGTWAERKAWAEEKRVERAVRALTGYMNRGAALGVVGTLGQELTWDELRELGLWPYPATQAREN